MSNDSIDTYQSSGNLNFKTAQKMIHSLLTCKRIKTDLEDRTIRWLGLSSRLEIILAPFTKQELAKKLGINQEELGKLESPKFYNQMAKKISFPLICLYCSTKFVDV